MLISLFTFLMTGIFFIVFAILFISKKIKMNSWYGIRTPITTLSEKIWYKVHSIMGRYLLCCGLLISSLSIYYYYDYTGDNFFRIYVLLFILIISSIFFIFLSKKVSYKIYKEYY
ncbi:MAG: hypothetical protein CR986_02620 [Ignavibacteriae bacterium]|nr:MAG: hypothetical protein CR986_02620 [Ignavibacteriota bacterium]